MGEMHPTGCSLLVAALGHGVERRQQDAWRSVAGHRDSPGWMTQDLTLPKSKVPLKATQLNSEAKRGRANSSQELSPGGVWSIGICHSHTCWYLCSPSHGSASWGGGLLTTKDKEEDEAYQCHPWSLAEMVASARNKMGSLGLHVFWPTDHLWSCGSTSRYPRQPPNEVN